MRFTTIAVALLLAAAPVSAQVTGHSGPGLPHDGRPEKHVDFPAIRDWSTLRITLTRTRCLGYCTAYTVTIAGDGTVTWNGSTYVKVIGPASGRIPRRKVRELFERFRKAEFFWLRDRYQASITDYPAQITTIAFDGHSKSVVDYVGVMVGMPQEVNALEQAIDDTANTAQWIGRKEERIGH